MRLGLTNSRLEGSGALLLASYVVRLAGRKVTYALLFLLLGSLTEGASVLLLIPMLQLAAPHQHTVAVGVSLLGNIAPRLAVGKAGLVPVLVAFILLTFGQVFFSRFRTIYTADLLYGVVNHMRVSLFESITRAKWTYLLNTRSSDLNHALTADIDRVQMAVGQILAFVQALVILLVYTLVCLLISPGMTVFAAVVGGVGLVALRPIRNRAASYGATLTGQRQEQYRIVSEFLSGMKIARSFNAESRYVHRLDATLTGMRKDALRFIRISTTGNIVFQVTSAIGAAAFIFIATRVFELPLAKIVVLIFLFMRISPRFNSLQSSMQDAMSNAGAFQAMHALQLSCDAQREEAPSGAGRERRLVGAVRFDNVSFHYSSGDGTSVGTLAKVSFMIPASCITALIGPSGSGKSTIADLVLGLLQPTGGTIWTDTRRLGPANREAWRDQVAYVPQDVFLLHDTIAENLRLAVPDATPAMMWEALEAAQAASIVRRLDGELEAVVGDRGIRLSGGERQRIALARGLLRKPELLILDEATSALDWESQTLIARSIESLRGSMTVITIAHRASMIAMADWVVSIDDGKVVETGPYNQLRDTPGSYLSRLIAGEHDIGSAPGAGDLEDDGQLSTSGG
ncbi:ABC transporter ATP-binding protein [Caulobacter sp. S45]|uniref:ABC transporter ATP-binding protein n=1 Tax=Caulobacter sp. S45 TaxID=1641861 RepID=UPI00131E875D|nr:ABC transporter ATP-binding protein [Caulobacter sp. S45]